MQQNTYGLKLNRLQEQTAQQLEAYLAEHPEAESVYCSTSFLPATELADVAHTCRKQGVVLHLLPLAPGSMPQTMQGECRGTVCVLSPAKLPLQSILRRTVKRLADIVLSLLVLLTVFPLFALIAFICIKRQSRGPVLVTTKQHPPSSTEQATPAISPSASSSCTPVSTCCRNSSVCCAAP